uniref:Uncharacterized protein n=1 Tax=Rhizophora mucronata TaxID=61149 RepID=A0A2P2QUH1_RHIMU
MVVKKKKKERVVLPMLKKIY